MIYIFNTQNQLVKTMKCRIEDDVGRPLLDRHHFLHSKDFPMDSFFYESELKKWYYKRTGKYLRPAPDTLVPKELKVLLLILKVPQ